MIGNQRGSALLVVITLVYSLFLLGLSLQTIVGGDLERAIQFRNRTRARFIAQAGVTTALSILRAQPATFTALNQGWYHQPDRFQEVSFAGGVFTVSHQGTSGETLYGMQDEESRIHLNKAPPSLLAALPGMNLARAEAAIRHRTGQPFATPAEFVSWLAAQPGGLSDGEREILPRLTTVWGTGRINLNTAPAPVLLALPGMTPERVARLLQHRRGPDGREGTADDQPFPSLAALQEWGLIQGEEGLSWRPLVTVSSTTFSFVSRASIGRLRPATVTVHVVVQRQGKDWVVKYWKVW
ncbi:MAG: hypothetical protein D6736_07990 [Nitrospinota bacterium]|nr:MAG: hypothetical protein D6736_07990 [Nitrospinota bacterium]